MRIVIDMQGAQTESRFRGIGRYSMSFARAVAKNRGDHEVILALSGSFPETIDPIYAAFDGLLPKENIRVWQSPAPVRESETGTGLRRESAELIREAFLASLNADVIHVTSLFEGYIDDAATSLGAFDPNTRVSVTLYDLIPLLNPDKYLSPNPQYARYYERKVGYLKKAAHLLAISEYARQECLVHLGVEQDRVVNVSTAIDDHFRPVNVDSGVADPLRARFGLVRPFVMYTGGADERKNLPRLIDAYAALPQNVRGQHQLLFAGKMPELSVTRLKHHATNVGLSGEELCFTGYVSDEVLVQLYNLCTLFVFPSWHEGFGLPALEAMACGAPVIAAQGTSLPEVVGLEEALFDPLKVTAISAKLAQGLEDDDFRARLRAYGLKRAAAFSWDETARRAWAAWEANDALRQDALPVECSKGTKPRLAFVSPLPPERTGIADYSAELIPALAEHYEIELVVVQDQVDLPMQHGDMRLRNVAWLRANVDSVDRVLYQMGNSPFHEHMLSLIRDVPGTVVLHDFYLSSLMSWLELYGGMDCAWTESLYQSHGYLAVKDRFDDPAAAKLKYPANFDVLQHAQGIIVHSDYSRTLARHWYGGFDSSDWTMIPLLRSPAKVFERGAIRAHLGLGADDFVVCSFGFIDATKLNHRLLNGWLASALAKDQRCHLIFIGANDGSEYGAELLATIEASGLGTRIQITGFAAPEKFAQYLMAADLAVQLRTQSRGETSAAILDCMNYGLPVIVNANGSMAELADDAVWKLEDEFDDTSLVEALEALWRQPEIRHDLGSRAQAVIRQNHSPDHCARLYKEAVEKFHWRTRAATPALIGRISEINQGKFSEADFQQIAQCIAADLPLLQPEKRLFLDVTATCQNDLKTGIERVARALLLAMLKSQPAGYRIEPVYLTKDSGVMQYRYARAYTLELLGCPTDCLDDDVVDPQPGDLLLTLDLSGGLLVEAVQCGLLQEFRHAGVAAYALVFDLLPVLMPEVFPPGSDVTHARWLRAVSTLDGAVCISKAVADDLARWQASEAVRGIPCRHYRVSWFHLGADIEGSAPSIGMPDNAEMVLDRLGRSPSFLMVGTIEPRKGYLQVLEAFNALWSEGIDVNLVIVGREGWTGLSDETRRDIPETIALLRQHPELNNHLFWLHGISDEYLEHIYAACTCLIAASYGEGFGLPLIEAARHGLPTLARDIPVFREVAGDHATYFDTVDAVALAETIKGWLGACRDRGHIQSDRLPIKTWAESTDQLLSGILPERVLTRLN